MEDNLTADGLKKLHDKMIEERHGKVRDTFIEVHPDSWNSFKAYLTRCGVEDKKIETSLSATHGIVIKENKDVPLHSFKLTTQYFGLDDEVSTHLFEHPSQQIAVDFGSQSWAMEQLVKVRPKLKEPDFQTRYDVEMIYQRKLPTTED